MTDICVLSDLEIPKGKKNTEHYCPKSRVEKKIWNNPQNWFPAHRLVNSIKANLMPCEWEDQKMDLTYFAMMHWRIHDADREFLQKTLNHWEEWHRDPCVLCLMKCNEKQK